MNDDLLMIDIIIHYIRVINSNIERADSYEIHTNSAKYLLGQTVRQLWLPKEKFYFSEAAKNLWNQIRPSEDIFKYWYRDRVFTNFESGVKVKFYKGANKFPYDERLLKKGESFIFKDIFHDDHIIPIKLILNRLLELQNSNRRSVMEVLDNISVCRMLKSEDREIHEKHNRPFSEKEIIEKIYGNYDIIISDYKRS